MAITMTTMTMQLPKWGTYGLNPKTLPLHKVCGRYSVNFLVLHQIYVLEFCVALASLSVLKQRQQNSD